jgi:hypothetical protein
MKYKPPMFGVVGVAVACSKMGCPAGPIALTVMDGKIPKDTLANQVGKTPLIPQDVRIRKDVDLLYIYEPSVQAVFEFNETASVLLQAIDGTRTLKEVGDALISQCEDASEGAVAEIHGFFENLRVSGFRLTLV